jgi:hypothetical protein
MAERLFRVNVLRFMVGLFGLEREDKEKME